LAETSGLAEVAGLAEAAGLAGATGLAEIAGWAGKAGLAGKAELAGNEYVRPAREVMAETERRNRNISRSDRVFFLILVDWSWCLL
jgi:hypothetical protein